jgi:RNA polymerase sigma factor (TIGR02999 family)
MSDVADALASLERDAGEELDRLFGGCYPELKKIAHARLRGTSLQGQIQTTALVHDGYLRLAARRDLHFEDSIHFYAYASRVLRSIVVDLVREQRALRRGGDRQLITLDTAAGEQAMQSMDVEAVNDALQDLEKLDPALARLVEMRFFGGMTEEEMARALGVSVRSVSREWQKARALLLTLFTD